MHFQQEFGWLVGRFTSEADRPIGLATRREFLKAEFILEKVRRVDAGRQAAAAFGNQEYAVLAELARHPDKVLTHVALLRAVWGEAHVNDVEYLRVVMRGLRLKLERDPSAPIMFRNEPGVGYRLVS